MHLDLRRPLAPGSDLFPLSSNGLASGNTRDEALVHALLEVIERDAWARFTDLADEAREERRIDLASVSSELPLQLLDRLERAGVRVAVWDLSGALDVACFLCQLVERDTEWAFPTGRAEGLGCHTDRAVALSRALCEAAQSRLYAIAGSRDDMTRASTERIRAPSGIQRAQRDLAGGAPGPRSFEQSPLQRFDGFDAEREWLTRALERWIGAEVFALDIPSHGLPISVVRVIVTRLRPPHFLPTRLPRPSFQLEVAR